MSARARFLRSRVAAAVVATVALSLVAALSPAVAQSTGSVIFIHPDGASSASWAAARALYVGPDGDLNWDRLPYMALYRGHMLDSLTATSNGGATTHATGRKVRSDAFGRSAAGEDAERLLDPHGRYLSVAAQAIDAGLPVGVVQSGTAVEPGTAIFLTDAAHRRDHDDIAAGLIESGARVILGGGERHFLPDGVEGRHGPGHRGDDRHLVEEAEAKGYTVVYNRDELMALPEDTNKVLGLFAGYHTFNDKPEEVLAAAGLPMYDPEAPTVAEMTRVALDLLGRDGQRFLLVVEEEGPDNFGNKNNASGMLEAMRRADEAFGVAQRYLGQHPDTLILTAADSDAGGMRLVGVPIDPDQPLDGQAPTRLFPLDRNGAPQDGVDGSGSAPFVSAPDRHGVRHPFSIVWATHDDASGGVLVRADGLNAHRVRGSMDNTELADLMRLTLFGSTTAPSPVVAPP